MQKIILYDAMSYLRVRMETEQPRDFLRGVLNECANPYGTRIWVWDGIGGNAKRRAIFPPYKTTRPKNPDMIRAMDFVRELIALTGVWQVRVPGFEGDDVVAALTQHFLATTDLPIHIQCRDADLTALCALSPRVTSAHAVKIPYHQIALYKICFGDGSDDIPGIKGFGQKSWDGADKVALGHLIGRLLDDQRPLREDEEAKALAIGIPKTSVNWLKVQENVDSVRAMRAVVAPLPVSQAEINAHMKQLPADMVAVEAKLKEFHL